MKNHSITEAITFYEELFALVKDQSNWSQKTFGSDQERGPLGPLRHLEKEAKEAQEVIHAEGLLLEELADCFLLVLDANRRSGFTLSMLVRAAQAKMKINKAHSLGNEQMQRENSKEVVASEGQYSRDAGRVPVEVIVERLDEERSKLVAEKQMLEAQLSEVESIKRDALTKVYRRGMHKEQACAATNEIEATFHKSRSKLIREKSAIDERLNDIKNRVKAHNVQKPSENTKVVEVLLRIEALLKQHVKTLD